MKVGIDARALRVEGGYKVCAKNLIDNLPNKKDFILFGVDKYNGFKCVDSKIKNDSFLRSFYENIILPKLLKKSGIEVFHGLRSSVPIFGNFKKVVTIHDISPIIYPSKFKVRDWVYWRSFVPIYLRRADKILASSENTKKDIIKYLNIDENKIKVIPLAYNTKLYKVKSKSICYKEIKLENIRDKRILLVVNTISPRKNIENIIKAFEKVAEREKAFILVIIGKKGWKYGDIMNTYNKSDCKERIIFLDFVPDETVTNFYNIAEALIYSSFYEGFGLPILEAQACGCPVITSNVSSMPEVAGKGAILVDPYNVDEIAKAMDQVLKDKKLRDDLIKKGFENIKRFSWNKCAKETLKVYEEVFLTN